jgi:hypothetical protein
MRAATVCGVFGSGSPMLKTPKITVLSPRHDFDAGALHVADREPGSIALRCSSQRSAGVIVGEIPRCLYCPWRQG